MQWPNTSCLPQQINKMDIEIMRKIREILENFYLKQRFNEILIKIKEVLMNILLLILIRKRLPVDTLSYSTFLCVWDTALTLLIDVVLILVALTSLPSVCASCEFCMFYSWCYSILFIALWTHIKCAGRNDLTSSSCIEPRVQVPHVCDFGDKFIFKRNTQ